MPWIDPKSGKPYSDQEIAAMLKEAPATAAPSTGAAPQDIIPDNSNVHDFPSAVGSIGSNMGQGAMASLKRTYLGLKQLGAYLGGDHQARQAVNDEIRRLEEEYGPALATPGGKLGDFLGTAGQMMVPGLNSLKLGRAALGAAGFEGAQPVSPGTTSMEDFAMQRGARAGLGALGGAFGAGLGKVITRQGTQAIPELRGINRQAEALGFKDKAALTPAQRTGDPTLAQYEEGLLGMPGSSGAIQSRRDAQQDLLNKSASKLLGYPGRNPTEAVFGAARSNANLAYAPIAQIDKLKTDVPYFDALTDFAKGTKSRDAARVALQIKKDGSLPGQAFLDTLQDVRTMAGDARSSSQHYAADQYKKLEGIMEDFLERRLTDLSKQPGNTITADTLKEYKAARLAHSQIHALEKATDPVLGEVSHRKVMKEQFKRQRPGSDLSPTSQGLKEVTDISRILHQVEPYIGSSGTAERRVGQQMVGEGLNPISGLMMAGPMMKNYLAAKAYLAYGGEPSLLGRTLPPRANMMIRRMLPPDVIAAGEAASD